MILKIFIKYLLRIIVGLDALIISAWMTLAVGSRSYIMMSFFLVMFMAFYLLIIERKYFPYDIFNKPKNEN